MSLDCLQATDIGACLAGGQSHVAEMPGLDAAPRPSAVLLPLFRQHEAWHLLFIRRAENQRDPHSGQVAFPGGRKEECDRDAVATALRESEEEIGLAPQHVQVLGELNAFHTVSNHLVRPVVGCIPWPLELRSDPGEVAHLFSIPLGWLSQPDNHRVETWPRDGHPQARPVVFFERYDDELLWGVSARITLDLIDRLNSSQV